MSGHWRVRPIGQEQSVVKGRLSALWPVATRMWQPKRPPCSRVDSRWSRSASESTTSVSLTLTWW